MERTSAGHASVTNGGEKCREQHTCPSRLDSTRTRGTTVTTKVYVYIERRRNGNKWSGCVIRWRGRNTETGNVRGASCGINTSSAFRHSCQRASGRIPANLRSSGIIRPRPTDIRLSWNGSFYNFFFPFYLLLISVNRRAFSKICFPGALTPRRLLRAPVYRVSNPPAGDDIAPAAAVNYFRWLYYRR